jgi:hypothetical protein
VSFFQSFAASAPDEPEPEPYRPHWFKPEAQVPGVVLVELVLAHNDRAAVLVSGLRAYRTGFDLTLTAILRVASREFRAPDAMQRRPALGEQPDPGFLRFGLRFADGRATANLPRNPPPALGDPATTGPVLVASSGGGDSRRYDMHQWVWPLPPAGPLTFVCEWPRWGIPETAADIDAQLVLDAAARSHDLWPEPEASA